MPKLVPPHGSPRLNPLLAPEGERDEHLARAGSLTRVTLSSREISDLLMLAMGAYTPLTGFMTEADFLTEGDLSLGGASVRYAFIEYTPRGTTGAYKIAISKASPNKESQGWSYFFDNPDDVVGLRLRPYGSWQILSKVDDF